VGRGTGHAFHGVGGIARSLAPVAATPHCSLVFEGLVGG
jgi:hypothetical protein